MDTLILKLVYLLYMVGSFVFRWPHYQKNKKNTIVVDKKNREEKLLLAGVFIGMMILPLVYMVSPLLSFADYQLPVWVHVPGVVIVSASLWLFYSSHRDLGQNWSPTLHVHAEHPLSTTGVYSSIRHPMYTAIWLAVIAQPMILNNYIAGFAGIVSFAVMYILRIGKEEAMMQERFKEAYRDYMKRTNRLIPGKARNHPSL